MPRCGNCRQSHQTVEDIKTCYRGGNTNSEFIPSGTTATSRNAEPATEKQVNYVQELIALKDTTELGKLVDQHVVVTMTAVLAGRDISKREASDLINALNLMPRKPQPEDEVPEGKYAVEGSDGIVQFWQVDKPTAGKWAGRVFVNMLVGSPGSWRTVRSPRVTSNAAMMAIVADTPGAAALFGIKTRTCGRCASPLSNIRSRAAGYGHHCAGVVGWPYPTKREAMRILDERGEDYSDLTDDDDEQPVAQEQLTPEWTV